MGAKVAAALAAVALSSASASIVGVVYTGVVSVRYDSAGAPSVNAVVGRARSGKGAELAATNVRFSSPPDSQTEIGSPCRDDFGKTCFVVFASPDLKFSFFGYTLSLPAEWYNYDWEDNLYRGGGRRFLAMFNDYDLVMSKNAPDSTGQETAATVVDSDNPSLPTMISGAGPIVSGPEIIDDPNPVYDPIVVSNPSVIDEVQPTQTPGGGAAPAPFLQSPEPTVTIPEPSTWTLILSGFAGLALLRGLGAKARRPIDVSKF